MKSSKTIFFPATENNPASFNGEHEKSTSCRSATNKKDESKEILNRMTSTKSSSVTWKTAEMRRQLESHVKVVSSIGTTSNARHRATQYRVFPGGSRDFKRVRLHLKGLSRETNHWSEYFDFINIKWVLCSTFTSTLKRVQPTVVWVAFRAHHPVHDE